MWSCRGSGWCGGLGQGEGVPWSVRPPAHGNGKDGGQAAEALPLCPSAPLSSMHSTAHNGVQELEVGLETPLLACVYVLPAMNSSLLSHLGDA